SRLPWIKSSRTWPPWTTTWQTAPLTRPPTWGRWYDRLPHGSDSSACGAVRRTTSRSARTSCLVSGGKASRNASTPVAIVDPVTMGPSFLRASQNRLGTLGILPADPKLRPRTPRRDDPEGAEASAHHPATNPLAFEGLSPELGRLGAAGGHESDNLRTVAVGPGRRCRPGPGSPSLPRR